MGYPIRFGIGYPRGGSAQWSDKRTKAILTGAFFGTAGASATANLPLLAEADTFYAASLTLGPVALTLPLLAEADTFYAASLTLGPVALTLPLVAEADTFYPAVIAVEVVSLSFTHVRPAVWGAAPVVAATCGPIIASAVVAPCLICARIGTHRAPATLRPIRVPGTWRSA